MARSTILHLLPARFVDDLPASLLTPIMLVAVLVGVMGGVLGAGSNGVNVTFSGGF